MAKWSESEIYQKTRGTSHWTRFVGWLNNLMNPKHDWVSDWSQYDQDTGGLSKAIDSVVSNLTQSDATGRDVALNEMQMQNQEDVYQRQVVGMQKAGINPALMYQSGASSAPSAPSASGGASMSDLMQLMLMPLQKRALEASIANTEAKTSHENAMTDESKARTEQIGLVNKYYPRSQEAAIDKILSEVGVNRATIPEKEANAALATAKAALTEHENKYADEFYHWRVEYEKAQTQAAKDAAAASAARAAWDSFELQWTREHEGARPSSAGYLAIAAAISDLLGLTGDSDGPLSFIGRNLKEKAQEAGDLVEDPVGTVQKRGAQIDEKLARLRDKYRRRSWRPYRNWKAREKNKYGLD